MNLKRRKKNSYITSIRYNFQVTNLIYFLILGSNDGDLKKEKLLVNVIFRKAFMALRLGSGLVKFVQLNLNTILIQLLIIKFNYLNYIKHTIWF